MQSLSLAGVQEFILTARCLTDTRKQHSITAGRPLPTVHRQVHITEYNGIPIIIKFGTDVSQVEVDVMKFVGKFTSVRVPIVHAFFIDDTSKMGFLVEERLPGCTLEEALPQMDENTQEVIINEFRNIYSQLDTLSSRRDSLGPLHGPWNNQWFHTLAEHFPIDEDTGRSVNTFLKYFYDVPGYYNIYRPKPTFEGILSSFDLSKPPVFSHGDLMPCNIMVENGHIVGVIDWAEAGWYPYFWDSYVLECTLFGREELDAAPMWKRMVSRICENYGKELENT